MALPLGGVQQAVVLLFGQLPGDVPENAVLELEEFYPAVLPAQEPEQRPLTAESLALTVAGD